MQEGNIKILEEHYVPYTVSPGWLCDSTAIQPSGSPACGSRSALSPSRSEAWKCGTHAMRSAVNSFSKEIRVRVKSRGRQHKMGHISKKKEKE